ncbi:EF-P lysine aminoacylase GenX [bacterium]|nr:EF-P lysine aminoacylase GenX [bacterium]
MRNNFFSTSNLENLKTRSLLLKNLRIFFEAKGYLEVETPLLSHFPSIDLHIEPFTTFSANNEEFFLQTSPEFAMKRLLACGFGSIFQVCKAFRNGEFGNLHNPEFTIVEWYKPGFSHFELMAEISELFTKLLQTKPAKFTSYKEAFETHLKINPFLCSTEDLQNLAKQKLTTLPNLENSKDDWLNFLLTEFVEKKLGVEQPEFLYNYPSSQAALSKINGGFAERFELYVDGIELCNGFHELTDAKEQAKRFELENQKRESQGKRVLPKDTRFLQALEFGIPACSGVALGFDRLVLLALKTKNIKETLTFSFENA